MVSLSPGNNRMSFSGPTNNDHVGRHDVIDSDTSAMLGLGGTAGDDLRLLSTPGSEFETLQVPNSGYVFKPIGTITTAVLLIICLVSLFAVSTLIPIECEAGNQCRINTTSLLMYLHCLFWGISLICDQIIQYEHIKLRRRGYLEVYAELRLLSQLPFWTISTWSTLLLCVSTILHDYCTSDGICGIFVPLMKSVYIMMGIGVELMILFPVICAYIAKVWRFNCAQPLPDVMRHDEMLTLQTDYMQNSLGQIDDELYQRQADLILYYKEQNAMLRKTVLDLNHQVYNRNRCTPGP